MAVFGMVLALLAPAVLQAQSRWVALAPPEQLECNAQANPLAVAGPAPLLSWVLRPLSRYEHGVIQSAFQIEVSSSLHGLLRGRADMWNTGKIRSEQTIHITYHGHPLQPGQEYFWQVRVWDRRNRVSRWSRVATWTEAPGAWQAKWIAAAADTKAAAASQGSTAPMPMFRDVFRVAKPVRRALLHVTGLGQYDARVNRDDLTADTLAGDWTNYRKTVLYDTYDVTRLLRRGRNVLTVLLGNGMYNVVKTPGRYTKFVGTFGEPRLTLELHIWYADGSSQWVMTDSSWRTAPGPVTFSSTYGGEDYDARRMPRNVESAAFDDASWSHAVEVAGPGGTLRPAQIPPVRVMQRLKPVKITEPQPGVLVYDMGVNHAGWPAIRVEGPAGTTVKLIPAELLGSDGLVSQKNSGSPEWFSYTLRGGGVETWHPLFSYYGFRYVEVEGVSTPKRPSRRLPRLLSLTSEAIHSDSPPVGSFQSSSDLFNRIHALILNAMQNNTVSLFTDCPHREKLGWLEETQLVGDALFQNTDLRLLYGKIARDMRNTQRADGSLPEIAPQYVVFPGDIFNNSPEWGSALVLDPWIAYRYSGNRRLLAANYTAMKRYTDYLESRAENGIVTFGLGDWYDVGPKPPGVSQLTTPGVTGTGTLYQDEEVMAKAARLLGKPADALQYEQAAARTRAAFNARFYHPQTESYDRGSQTDLAIPLALGFVPAADRAAVLKKLVDDLANHDYRITSGEVGFHYLIQTMLQAHRADVLNALLSSTRPYSYGGQLARGATSLTEAWNANPRNSQDHFMLGSGDLWFYRGLGGIDFNLARPFEQVLRIRPEFVPGLQWCKVSYNSVLGTIATNWRRGGNAVELEVTVPPNLTATVMLPAGAKAEGPGSREVLPLPSPDGETEFSIGSGIYRFTVPQDAQ